MNTFMKKTIELAVLSAVLLVHGFYLTSQLI